MLKLSSEPEKYCQDSGGISADIPIANKTGETDSDQHDMAIVYGPKTTYILCVMSKRILKAEAKPLTISEVFQESIII